MGLKWEIAGGLPDIAKMHAPLQTDDTKPKRILVAGAHSYIGRSFACFMKRWPDIYQVDMLGTEDDSWVSYDFAGYDAVLYAAGEGQDCAGPDVYQAVKIADRAKCAEAGMFLYLSSLHVYGMETGVITKKTPVSPSNAYGKLILNVEKELWKRKNEKFCVAILRLPAVYGYECEGSYQKLAGFIVRFGFFPEYKRKNSMIHVDNVSSAVRGIIHNGEAGVYFPQNISYVSAYEMAREIANFHGIKLKSTKLLNPVLWLLAGRVPAVQNIFCGFICGQGLNVPEEWLEVKSLRESVRLAESGW